MSFQLRFGSLDLTDIATWREDIPSRISEQAFPRRQGVIAPARPAVDGRRIALNGVAMYANESAFLTYLNDLSYELSVAGRQPLQLRTDAKYYKAVKERFSWELQAQRLPDRSATLSLQFLADDPHLYNSTVSTQTDNLTGTTGTFTITNNGRAPTPPVFELTRSAGTDQNDVLLTHTGSGQFLQVRGVFAVGTKIVFDCVNKRVVQAGNLALDSFLGLITFELRPGLNNFTYSGPGNVSIATTWHERSL